MSDLWKSLRAEHVGGSEVAALFGHGRVSRYRLYHEKRGNMPPEDLDENERVQAGRFMESGALAWANAKWGTDFYQPNVYVKHATIKGMGCTPDAFVRGNSQSKEVIAQVKIVDSLQFKKEWESDGEVITEAPLDILLQCQHEMACTGARENHMIVLVGGNRLLKMIVQRDEDVIKIIESHVQEFWRSIRENIEPEPEFSDDGQVIRTLWARLPVVMEEDLTDDGYIGALIDRLKLSSHARKIAADAEESQRNELIYMCQGVRRVRHGDNIINFITDKNGRLRVMINSEKMAFTTGE